MNSCCTVWGNFWYGHHLVHSPWYTTNPYPLSATEIFKKFELGKLNWAAAETMRASLFVARQLWENGCHQSLPFSSLLCGQTSVQYGCKGSIQSAFLCAVPHVFEPNTVIDCLNIAPDSLKVNLWRFPKWDQLPQAVNWHWYSAEKPYSAFARHYLMMC